ncbi:hypothetical protein BS47DRAFT_1335516 [Hydnum rufescens UP504]|uniref:SWI/SNF and RSC complexes subunit Ssr4 N-terminal domain-containing protein n=1 Tax=Hydnum rufescens UP504 TaxID=1448309 RepID=A0A9P6BB37_9AGAM|nr:hypothetical protein BS47DRAFT_1335516 [Hydnum rufescens UP504]
MAHMNMNRPQAPHGPPMQECYLRLNHDFPPQQNYGQEAALKTLLRVPQVSITMPYSFVHIDKANEGDTHAIYLLQSPQKLPPDGIRYLEEEQRFAMSVGPNVEMEILETKGGFIPGGGDAFAWRVRRIFRLTKGGHPSMAILHYSRGTPMPIPPHLINQPVRAYPLREVNEPSIYVTGEKMGTKIYPQQQALMAVASQNAALGQMERRRDKERREAPVR